MTFLFIKKDYGVKLLLTLQDFGTTLKIILNEFDKKKDKNNVLDILMVFILPSSPQEFDVSREFFLHFL